MRTSGRGIGAARRKRIEAVDRGRDLGGTALALHAHRPDDDMGREAFREACSMSRMTAPVGDVTMPTTRGRNGSGRLRSSSNKPSAANLRLRSSSSAISAPTPAGSICSMTIWYFDEPG